MKEKKDNPYNSSEASGNGMTRRKALAASSGLGGAIFGIKPVAGKESGDEREEEYTTEQELRETLEESDHIFLDPDVRQRFTEAETESISSTEDLDQADTPGPEQPDIYYGKYKNAEPPSGQYYEIAEEGAWRERDHPISLGEDNFRPHVSDLLTVSEDVGCTTMDFPVIGEQEPCVVISGGFEISGTTDGMIGGELFLDISVTAAGQEVTVSPGGFGFHVGPDDVEGYCFEPNLSLPGPMPGGEIEMCGEITLETRNSELRFGLGVTGLDICANPCGPVNCEVCGTVISTGATVRTPWVDVDDLPMVPTIPT
ncbi:hypothetical protein [Halostagnicola bangensis]